MYTDHVMTDTHVTVSALSEPNLPPRLGSARDLPAIRPRSARDLPAICLRSALARMAFPCEPGVALNTWQARVVETLTRYNIEREARHLRMAIDDVSKGKPLPAAITPW